MFEAERRSRIMGKVLRDGARPAADLPGHDLTVCDDVPCRWYNGLVPIFTILAVGVIGLYWTGTKALEQLGIRGYDLGDIVSAADSYKTLLWASLSGCVVAIILTLSQRIMRLERTMEAWVGGMNSMLLAMIILILAWSIGSVTEELHTADYLVQLLRGVLSPYWLPAMTFVIAAAVAFSTGTSWATMAILMPLVIPLTHTLTMDLSLDAGESSRILIGVISSVLAGAVFGDHCSPISDTTILSSMSSACDHIDHVRTQLPYAILAAFVGIFIGDLPTAYGFPPLLSLLLGTSLMLVVLLLGGRRVPDGVRERL
jgi:Na+/H+ antiporter NhaC